MAAGKAKGQEAVWRSQCKPAWWDCVCPHPWKNPTANPKDCKDTLKVKFECLLQHLRKKEQLPKEMEEEISLWEADRKPEVFLMTSFSSLLGQASNLHTMVQDTCKKMEETGMSVAPSILTDLQRCLLNCANKLDTIKNMSDKTSTKDKISKPVSHTVKKRPREEIDHVSEPQSKRSKYCSSSSPLSSSQSPSPVHILSITPSTSPSLNQTLPQSVSNTTISSEQSKAILAFLQKQLLQKKCSERSGVEIPAGKTQTVKSNASPVQSKRKQIGKKMKVDRVGQGNAVASAGLSPTVCLSTTVSHSPIPGVTEEHTEFQDFLELDLPDNEDVIDCQFVDSLLETSPAPGVNVTATNVVNTNTSSIAHAPSVNVNATDVVNTNTYSFQQVSCQGTTLNSETFKQSNTKHDPFLGHTGMTCDSSEIIPFVFGVSEVEADRQVVNDSMEGGVGMVLLSGVGNTETSFGDTDAISDSGYNSESSITASHRSSVDSDHCSYSDLNSPDLEAYLDSLQ